MTKIIYLDQMKWIDLARAYHGRPDGAPFRHVLDLALRATGAKAAVFPLSDAHYAETLKSRNPGARLRLAQTMAALSGFDTFAPGHTILDFEFRKSLAKRVGFPPDVQELKLLGKGHNFAFGDPTPGPLQPPGSRLWFIWEVAQLAGAMDSGLPDVRAESSAVLARCVETMQRQDAFDSKYNVTAEERRRLIRVGLLSEQLPRVARILSEGNAGADVLAGLPKDWYWDMFDELSLLVVDAELQNAHRSNRQRIRRGTDVFDIGTLDVAIAYTDVVVTERYWAHVAHATHLDTRFSTLVVSHLQALVPILEEALNSV